MAVDKNLFRYDLAIVTIMKDEAPYIKEWLDYHLLAGTDHFYFYDNGSTDNAKEILQPYIDAGIVTYKFFPGQNAQMWAYNDAVKKYKFQCRYMSFVDCDEFLRPKDNRAITEVVDEFLAVNPNTGGLEINWVFFGSNNQETADYTRGVLERFTQCGELSKSVKTIANPRRVHYITTPHYMFYYDGIFGISNNTIQWFPNVKKAVSDDIVMNHYYAKSREEYANKIKRGAVAHTANYYSIESWAKHGANDFFDDSILKYRDSRRDAICPAGGGVLETLAPRKAINYDRLFTALLQNLAPTFGKGVVPQFLNGKLETFLTCLNLSTYLKNILLDDSVGKFCEEASLKAIYKSLLVNIQLHEAEMLIRELPNILPLKYPVVNDIRNVSTILLQKIKDYVRLSVTDQSMNKLMLWKDFTEWDYIEMLLKTN